MRTLRQHIPASLKRALRAVYYFALDTYQSVSRTRKPMTPPAMTSFLVGGGDFHSVGKAIKESLIQTTDLTESSKILEIGCGYGRVAVALTELLGPHGHYDGTDVVKAAVGWCTDEISSRHPNFRFIHADVSNPYANDGKGSPAETYRLPFPDNTYDLVFLTSVFSHMRPEEIRAYLQEISRVLKRGANCYATYYLIDDFASKQITNGKTSQDFKYDFGNFLSTHKHVPEQTIAVQESLIRSYYLEAGLTIVEPILLGGWANRAEHYGYQDVIIARC